MFSNTIGQFSRPTRGRLLVKISHLPLHWNAMDKDWLINISTLIRFNSIQLNSTQLSLRAFSSFSCHVLGKLAVLQAHIDSFQLDLLCLICATINIISLVFVLLSSSSSSRTRLELILSPSPFFIPSIYLSNKIYLLIRPIYLSNYLEFLNGI